MTKKRISKPSKAVATPAARAPDAVTRYAGEVVCVLRLTPQLERAIGPEGVAFVLRALNARVMRIVLQTEGAVFNLTAYLLFHF